MALETVGVRLAVEGANQAVKALESVDKALGKLSTTQGTLGSRTGGASLTSGIDSLVSSLRPAGSAVSGYTKSLESLGKAFPQVNQAIQTFGQITGVNVPVIGSATSSLGSLQKAIATIPPPALAAGAAIVGLTAGLAALTALGSRGAGLQPTINAFGNLAGQFGDSSELLQKYREQTKGAVTDIELMRGATLALSGTSTELGTILSKNYGQIINDVGRLAQALGLDATQQQEKFTLALKTGQRDLIDQLGLIVSADQAYKDYAKSINVSASALTEQQKKTAFSIAVIEELNNAAGKLGKQSTVLADLKAPFVSLQNVLDRLSIAVLPLFAPFAAGVASIFRAFESGVTTILPLVEIFSQLGGLMVELTGKFLAFTFSLTPLPMILGAIGDIVPYIVAGFQVLRDAINSIAGVAGPAIAALAATIRGGLASILPAFPQFGQGINDSLATLPYSVGRTGANIIGSFAAGLLQGGKYVVDAVTAIATIVADFLQGFSPPKKGPLSTIDQGGANVAKAWAGGFLDGFQQTAAQAAQFVSDQLGDIAGLAIGQVTSRLSMLDQALQPFNEQLTIAKGIFEQIAGVADPALKVINRQLEAALKAKDSQAVQRLDAQAAALKQLKAEQQGQLDNAELQLALAKAQQAQERALLTVQKERLGGGATATEGGGGGAGAAERAANEAAKAAGGGGGGAAGGATETPAPFQAGQAPDILSTQAVQQARENIQAVVGQVTAGAAEGLGESGFNEALGEITASTGELQTQLGRIASARPGDKIGEQLAGITQKLAPVKQAFTDLQTTIGTAMTSIGGIITTAFGPEGTITLAFSSLFGEGMLLGTGGAVQTAITSLFGPDNPITIGIPLIEGLVTSFTSSLSGAFTSVKATLAIAEATFNKFKTTIETVLDAVTTKVGGLPGGIESGLSGLGEMLQKAMVVPFVSAINGIIGSINDAFSKFADGVNSLSGILGISVPIPQIAPVQIPGAARGGVGLRGLTMVGERGPELVNFGKPATVFPNLISELIMGLAAQPAPVYVSEGGNGGNGGGNTSNQTINSTFNVGSSEQGRLLERQRAAFMGY